MKYNILKNKIYLYLTEFFFIAHAAIPLCILLKSGTGLPSRQAADRSPMLGMA